MSKRRHAPSTDRNREPILAVLQRVLSDIGGAQADISFAQATVLEVASGTGQHTAWFAPRLPGLAWQPSEADGDMLESIAAHTNGIGNVRPALALDVTAEGWEQSLPATPAAIFNANMIHITPWATCEGLVAGAGRSLMPGGLLILYGPFRRKGYHTSQSNADFDLSLRRRNPAWGVRDLETVTACADINGLDLDEVVEMPANNLMVLFRRR